MKTRCQSLSQNLIRLVMGSLLGLMFLVIALAVLQASTDASSPAAAAPNDTARTSPEHEPIGPPSRLHPGQSRSIWATNQDRFFHRQPPEQRKHPSLVRMNAVDEQPARPPVNLQETHVSGTGSAADPDGSNNRSDAVAAAIHSIQALSEPHIRLEKNEDYYDAAVEAYREGTITDPDLVGVEALDDTHVRFTLTGPASYFPMIAGLWPARPQPQWAIEAHGDGWTDPGNIVTTGPYKPAAWEHKWIVTSTADSGPGTLRQALLGAQSGDTITFDTTVFPPGDPMTIALTSGLPNISQGDLTIDASDAGVILDGSGIGTTPETMLLDDVSLTLDGGPNLIANGDFSAGLGHWRPWDEGLGATRSITSTDFKSPPNAYEWTTVAHAGETRMVYDTTDASDPFDDGPFYEGSTVWMPATGGSTVEVRFWYRDGRVAPLLWALFPDGVKMDIPGEWFSWEADWTEAVFSPILPTNAVGVALGLRYRHSERGTSGFEIESSGNTIRGLQVVNFPGPGIRLHSGAQDNTIGGDRSVGAGPMGQGNLISGNGDQGVGLWDTGTSHNTIVGNYIGTDLSGTAAWGNRYDGVHMNGPSHNRVIDNLISGNGGNGISISGFGAMNNTVSGNYIGTDASGTAAVGNAGSGVYIGGGASYNLIGGDTAGERNLISGNGDVGVNIFDSNNTVSGNYIGADVSGTSLLSNGYEGVSINGGASNNTIGGSNTSPGEACTGECNLISGNDREGVWIGQSGTVSNTVSGNYIGTDVNGIAFIGNKHSGIHIENGGSYNVIGGDTPGERNLISGNSAGVSIAGSDAMSNTVQGNWIGLDLDGARQAFPADMAISPDYPNDCTLYVATLSTGVHKSADCGDTWAEVNNGLTESRLMQVEIPPDASDASTVYALAENGHLFVTTDGGANWSLVSTGLGEIDRRNLVFSADFSNDQTMYAAAEHWSWEELGGGPGVFKSTDGGVTWTRMVNGMSDDHVWKVIISPDPAEKETLFALTQSGIEKSTDGGANWSSVASPGTDLSDLALSPAYASDQTVFVTAYTGRVYSSTVGGGSWNGVDALRGDPRYLALSPDYAIDRTVCHGGGWNDWIYCSTDGGVTWTQTETRLPGALRDEGTAIVFSPDYSAYPTMFIASIAGVARSETGHSGEWRLLRGLRDLGNGRGVSIGGGASHNVVGPDNVISNNHQGVTIEDDDTAYNVVVGNLIGTDPTGTFAQSNSEDGVTIWGGHHNLIGGGTAGERNVVGGTVWGEAVRLNGGGVLSNTVSGNYIGTNVSGTAAIGNVWKGVAIHGGASYNVIGGDTAGERNIISGNGWGIGIWDSGTRHNTVSGNYIGVDATGGAALPNRNGGVEISGGASYNLVGGSTSGERNVISGNDGNGVSVDGSDTVSNTVSGNYIGVDVSGANALPNQGEGISINNWASYNLIGGPTAGERNVISANGAGCEWCDGIFIGDDAHHNTVQGNYIGTDVTGTFALGNRSQGVDLYNRASDNVVRDNLIAANGENGIAIWNDSTRNVVEGNRIGTDASGTLALPNDGNGVSISDGASYNLIGGSNPSPGGACAGECNVISSNSGNGVKIYGSGTMSNTVSGNYIGTDVTGTAGLGNDSGVFISDGAQYNTIGGMTSAERNIISSNGEPGPPPPQPGVSIHNANHNAVIGNYIGSDVTGSASLPNKIGVHLYNSHYNHIAQNLISGNAWDGVLVEGASNTVSGNYIGTDASGTAPLANEGHGVHIWYNAQNNTIGGSNASPGGACSGDCNLISGNGSDGVRIKGNDTMSNTISGNHIGINATSTLPLGNGGDGVRMEDGTRYNVIGGDSPDERNVVSGNSFSGVSMGGGATENVVIGNYIGTDASGMAALGNGQASPQAGVALYGDAHHNRIGSSSPAERNVISGNHAVGVAINLGLDTDYNIVVGNYIGTDATGTGALGNTFAGVYIADGASENVIGGTTTSDGNVIAHNDVCGVYVHGASTLSNTISHNSIHSNTDLGIDLRSGANGNIVAPVITSFNTATGDASGTACAGCIIEVFSDDDDEGRWYEGTTTADGVGNWSFSKGSAFTGANVHATATDAAGNTSEFSGSSPVVSSVSPTSTVPGTHDLGIAISGDRFRDNEPLTVDFGAGVTVTGTQFISRTQIKVYLDVDPSAALGPRDVTVTNYDGQSGTATGAFSVTVTSPFPTPVVDSITPTIALQGKRMDLTIYGQNFVDRPTVTFNNGDIAVNTVTVVSSTELLADIAISSIAPAGLHDLTVTNPDGQSDTLPGAFEVEVRLFTDVSYGAGIGTRGQRGVAWGDYDNDGYVDLFVTNHNVLYRNNGDGTFADVTAAAGGLWWGGEGVVWGDYDNDGDLDLYTSDWGSYESLYRNEGDGTFTDVTDQAGLQDPGHGQTVAWGDYDGDGDVDLYVTNTEGDPNHLYRNEGDGTFSDVTAQAQVTGTGYSSSVAWGDYDNDGDSDLYITNSRYNHLFQNQGDGTFVDQAAELGVTAEAYGGGTGVAWGDYDNDDDLDLGISAGGTAVLFRNDGNAFADVTASAGVGSAGIGGMGMAWADYDNDGWLDLYVTSDEGSALYHNNGDGTFAEVTDVAGVDSGSGNWGTAWGDYDNDGDLDLFVVKGGLPELGEPDLQDILYRNNGNSNHWLHVKTVGTISNRTGTGARVRVIAGGLSQIREVSGGSGRTSQDSLPVEFGFGTYTDTVTVEVTWPSGVVTTLTDVAVDQVLVVNECRAEDLNCDNQIDIQDIQLAANAWHTRVGEAGYDLRIDLNRNGRIDISDVQRVAASWGWQAGP